MEDEERPMDETRVLDILKSEGCFISVAAFVLMHSSPGDDIRACIPSLIEQIQDLNQELCLKYCAEPPS